MINIFKLLRCFKIILCYTLCDVSLASKLDIEKHSFFLAALHKIMLNSQTEPSGYDKLVDMDSESCIKSQDLLIETGHYLVEMFSSQKLYNGLITVHFNETVDCKGRKVRHLLKFLLTYCYALLFSIQTLSQTVTSQSSQPCRSNLYGTVSYTNAYESALSYGTVF